MSFPTVQARNTGNQATNTATHTVNLPSGISAGDLLVIVFSARGSGTVSSIGWTSLGTEDDASTINTLTLLYKSATGTEGSTATVFTANSCRSAHNSYRITGWSGTPEKGTVATGNSAAPNSPSLSPSWGSADTLFIAAFVINGAKTVSAYPTSYSNGQSNSDGSLNTVASSERQLTASSDDPAAATTSASAVWAAQTLAIKPIIGTLLTADAGTFSETGIDSLFKTSQLSAVGAFTETGVAALFKTSLLSVAGSYALTGVAASFNVGAFVTAGIGTYALTGVAASMKVKFVSAATSYTLSGLSATFKPKLASTSASFALSMGSATSSLDFISAFGEYDLVVNDATLKLLFGVHAENGSFLVTTFPAQFSTTMEQWTNQNSGSESWAAQSGSSEIWTPQNSSSETWH